MTMNASDKERFNLLIKAGRSAAALCGSVAGAVSAAAQEYGFILTDQEYAEIIKEAQNQELSS